MSIYIVYKQVEVVLNALQLTKLDIRQASKNIKNIAHHKIKENYIVNNTLS